MCMLCEFHFAMLLLRGESIVESICEITLVQYCYIYFYYQLWPHVVYQVCFFFFIVFILLFVC